jgi:hypothetical protein
VWKSLVAAQAGEGRLIIGVDGLVLLATATAATEVAAGSAAGGTTGSTATTATASITTGSVATGATATTAAAAPSALRLDVTVLELDELLGLALTLALGLAAGAGEELLLGVLGDGSEVLPLVVLDTLVGLADAQGAKAGLLLGELSKVLVVGDVLVLGLLLLSLALGGSLTLGLLLGLGDLSASLLILQLGLALVGAPRLGSLLLRVAATEDVNAGPAGQGLRKAY